MPLNLEPMPLGTDLHSWADWVELLCLANVDGTVARSDVLDRWTERMDVDPRPEAGGDGADETTEDDSDGVDEEGVQIASSREGLLHERRVRRIDDVFRHLAYRAQVFGTSYPFELQGPALVRLGTSESRGFYSFLLIASGKQWVRKQTDRNRLEKAFERVTAVAVRHWLPATEVHVFGTSRRSHDRYTGDLPKRILKLAEDINEDRLLDEAAYRVGNYGDGGLDVVGWRTPLDAAAGTLVLFVQATTERQWAHKQADASFDKWRHRLTLKAHPLEVLAIPYCFRTPEGRWYLDSEVYTIILDRVRLMSLLQPEGDTTAELPAIFLASALAYREAVA